jgi:hypothetical protein
VSIRAAARYDFVNLYVNQTNTFKHFALWMNAAPQGRKRGWRPNIAIMRNDFCSRSNRKGHWFY